MYRSPATSKNMIAKESGELSAGTIASPLPTRVITYAWGEQYLDILLSLTIPALLAPGNLPYVATATPCELVILTEERFFPAASAHRSIIRAKQFCGVRLIALDDLIAQKDKYGMALTYALHRGFSNIGPTMTDSWEIFLNADFILAEGSLRTVISLLAQGERLVASPSYCVNALAVIPELRKRVCKDTGSLSIPPRELAAIALANRHATIRGKTVNQSEFSLRYMDQFYWLVDDRTLLGHQMPIAIVGMRPERHVVEPNSYWDHGLMKEYCPEAEICVLGDSDEFLMLELREKDVAQELIEAGRPPLKTVAENMVTFLTPYQRNCARHELTLHSGEIPPETATARHKLRAYVDEVLSHLPAFLPSHIDHPQWNYHRPDFVAFRHKFLSQRLGLLTEVLPPPPFFSELDRAWWKFDGMEKYVSYMRTQLRDFIDRELRLLQETANDLERLGDVPSTAARSEFECKVAAIRSRIALQRSTMAQKLDKSFSREGLVSISIDLLHLERPSLQTNHQHHWTSHRLDPQYSRQLNETASELFELFHLGTQLLDLELERRRNEYRLLMPRRIASAAIPYVKIDEMSGMEGQADTLLRKTARALFRNAARRALGLEPLLDITAAAAGNSASRVLRVGSASGLTGSIVDRISGSHVWISTAGMRTGHFRKAFATAPKFDLCICDLNFAELLEFPSLVAEIRPFMVTRGTIVAYHFNENSALLPPDSALVVGLIPKEANHIYRTGSRTIAFLLNGLRHSKRLYHIRKYDKLFVFLMRFALRVTVDSVATAVVLFATGFKFLVGHKQVPAADLRRSAVIKILVA
jgi:hypothetical protein